MNNFNAKFRYKAFKQFKTKSKKKKLYIHQDEDANKKFALTYSPFKFSDPLTPSFTFKSFIDQSIIQPTRFTAFDFMSLRKTGRIDKKDDANAPGVSAFNVSDIVKTTSPNRDSIDGKYNDFKKFTFKATLKKLKGFERDEIKKMKLSKIENKDQDIQKSKFDANDKSNNNKYNLDDIKLANKTIEKNIKTHDRSETQKKFNEVDQATAREKQQTDNQSKSVEASYNDAGFNLGTGAQVREKLLLTADNLSDSFTWTADYTGNIALDFSHSALNGLKIKVTDANGKVLVNAIEKEAKASYAIDVEGGAQYRIDISKTETSPQIDYDFSIKWADMISSNYAILFSGGYDQFNNHTRYDNAMENIYDTLLNDYNLNPKNIYVIYADGTDPGVDLSNGTSSDMSYLHADTPLFSATNANLQTAAEHLLTKIDFNDHFLFWTFDHGFGTKNAPNTFGEEGLNGWNAADGTEENVNDEFIFDQISPIMQAAAYSTMVLGQCFAGGVLDDFQNLIDQINANPSKSALGMSAANHFESSFGSSFIDEFNNAFNTHNSAMTTYRLAHDNDIYAVARGTYAPNTSTVANQGVEEHPWVWPSDNADFDFKIMHTGLYATPWLDHLYDIPKLDLDKLLELQFEKEFIKHEFPIELMPPFPEPIPPCPVPFTYDQLMAAAKLGSTMDPIQPLLGFEVTDVMPGFNVYSIDSPALLSEQFLMNNANSPYDNHQMFYNIVTKQFSSLRDIANQPNEIKNGVANKAASTFKQWCPVATVEASHQIGPNDIILVDGNRANDVGGTTDLPNEISPFSVRAFNGNTVSTEAHLVTVSSEAAVKTLNFSIKEDNAISNIIDQLKAELGVKDLEAIGQPYHGSFQSNDNKDIHYEPVGDFFGSDSFTVRYQDAKGQPVFATVNIDIQSVNDAPIAISDVFNVSVKDQQSVVLDVIDSKPFTTDYDPDHLKQDLQIELLDAEFNVVDTLKQGHQSILTVIDGAEHQQILFNTTAGERLENSTFHYRLKDPEGAVSEIAEVQLNFEASDPNDRFAKQLAEDAFDSAA